MPNTRPRRRTSLLYCITCVLRSCCRRTAQARPWAAYAGTRSIIGRVFGRAAVRKSAPQQGDARAEAAERTGGVCQAVLTGSLAGRTLLEVETEAAPLGPWWFRCLGASRRGSLTREIGRARMERIDGASRGKKKSWSLFPAYVLRGNERAAEPGVHALPRASRNRMFADASLFEVSSRGPRLLPLRVWRMAFLGTWKGLHS
jgi:hypothetical protein